jgi:Domain of unknown function (DUF6265)
MVRKRRIAARLLLRPDPAMLDLFLSALPMSAIINPLAAILIAYPAILLGQENAATAYQDLNDVAWLTGCWSQRTATGTTTDEQWMAPSGGSMMGMSRNVRDGRTVGYEFVRLVQREGVLVFMAMPSGQAPAEFSGTSVSDQGFVVENPDHDFPKRIEYLKNGPDSLIANVSADENGFQVRMGRVLCDIR